MSNTNSAADRFLAEKKLAGQAVTALRSGMRYAIERTTNRQTGQAIKEAGSRSVFKEQRLQRLTLRAPHYIFKQHHGFEGTKKNGVNMRLKATDVLNIAIERANILETLSDGISEIRLDEVTSRINFK
jgi:hypothetical protein